MEEKLFHDFPPQDPVLMSGVFGDNISLFLNHHGVLLPNKVDEMKVWLIHLVKDGKRVPLYVAESQVDESGEKMECDHCSSSGWSHHFISRSRYRFIIPKVLDWSKESLETGFTSTSSHHLYALLHSNGFGHLILINGIETGLSVISGRDLMSLFDRICSCLAVRKVSVWDTSQKHSMQLRLLYGVAYGHPWMGKWEYTFYKGSFGVTEDQYNTAISSLGSLSLNQVVQDFGTGPVKNLIDHYCQVSNTKLRTLKELLHLMLSSKTQTINCPWPSLPPSRMTDKVTEDLLESCLRKKNEPKWKKPTVEKAKNLITTMLRKKGRPMTRGELQDDAKKASVGGNLIDFVMPQIVNHVFDDGSSVRCRVVKGRNVYDVVPYGLRVDDTIVAVGRGGDSTKRDHAVAVGRGVGRGGDSTKRDHAVAVGRGVGCGGDTSEVDMVVAVGQGVSRGGDGTQVVAPKSFGVDIYSDLQFLYKQLFFDYPLASRNFNDNVQAILNTKCFAKEWPLYKDSNLRFVCCFEKIEQKSTARGEIIVVLPQDATYPQLITSAQDALRKTFHVTANVIVNGVVDSQNNFNPSLFDNDNAVSVLLKTGSEIIVVGEAVDLETDLKYEGGAVPKVVNCSCGAKEMDGEDMWLCLQCQEMNHPKCSRPAKGMIKEDSFLCGKCSKADEQLGSESGLRLEYPN